MHSSTAHHQSTHQRCSDSWALSSSLNPRLHFVIQRLQGAVECCDPLFRDPWQFACACHPLCSISREISSESTLDRAGGGRVIKLLTPKCRDRDSPDVPLWTSTPRGITPTCISLVTISSTLESWPISLPTFIVAHSSFIQAQQRPRERFPSPHGRHQNTRGTEPSESSKQRKDVSTRMWTFKKLQFRNCGNSRDAWDVGDGEWGVRV